MPLALCPCAAGVTFNISLRSQLFFLFFSNLPCVKCCSYRSVLASLPGLSFCVVSCFSMRIFYHLRSFIEKKYHYCQLQNDRSCCCFKCVCDFPQWGLLVQSLCDCAQLQVGLLVFEELVDWFTGIAALQGLFNLAQWSPKSPAFVEGNLHVEGIFMHWSWLEVRCRRHRNGSCSDQKHACSESFAEENARFIGGTFTVHLHFRT